MSTVDQLLRAAARAQPHTPFWVLEKDYALHTPHAWGMMRAALLRGLDAWLVENELYREVTPPTMLAQVTREDLQLICWEAVGL